MVSRRTGGTRWRLLVHDIPQPGSEMYGTAHHIESGQAHNETTKWRKKVFDAEALAKLKELQAGNDDRVLPDTEFDELVVGSWIHIEQMDNNYWWMNIGGVTVHVTADNKGQPKQVTVHMPGHYDDPVKGCTYRLDDEDYTA